MCNDDQHEEDSNQESEDLVEDLRRHMVARTPVEVYLLGKVKTPLGFIVHVGDDHAPLPASSPVTAAKFDGLLKVISEQFAMVVLTGQGDGSLNTAGEIVEVSNGALTARVLSRAGYWEPDTKRIALPEISALFFGSPYEHTLELVGRLPDAHRQDRPRADGNVDSER